jgi:MFS family permease
MPKALTLLRVPTSEVGIVFAANTAAVVFRQLPIARVAAGRKRVGLLQLQFAIFVVRFGICWVAATWRILSPTGIVGVVLVASVVFAVGECVMGSVRSPMVVDMAPPALVGRCSALMSMMFPAGMSIGRPVGAFALTSGQAELWVFAGTVALVGIANLQRLRPQISDQHRFTAATL